ncbi:hypothetical protein BD779DRAFT_1548875 [Infundibulicybe gibba]|nr:hypothetical protein BD779DRAFT_1548875 [Infundibulicybe gibba]
MKSLPPRPKTEQSAQAPVNRPAPEAGPLGASNVLDVLQFKRLYHGPLADALLFLSVHMKGRADVALARQQIHQLREMRAKSGIKHPNDVTRSAADKASAALYKKELDNEQVALIAPQAEIDGLERRLNDKRRVQMLLDALEQKEKLRIRRFREMKLLIEEQRKSTTRYTELPEPTRRPVASLRKPRLSYTRDILAQLRSLVDRYSHSGPDKLGQKIISSARERARYKVSYRNPHPRATPISKHDIDAKLESIRDEELSLQHLSLKSLALLVLAEQSIQSISIFLNQTSGLLRSSIDKERLQVKGFVEVLRHQIVTNPETQREDGEFLRQAIVACGMRGNMAPGAVVDRVTSLLHRCHQQENFLAHRIFIFTWE